MVDRFATACDKETVDMTAFKPLQFAAMAVYYTLCLGKANNRSQNGLSRWCFGIKTYVCGADIELESDRQPHLASRCLPRHYNGSGVSQPAEVNKPCQAIASAPVTCELCHVGLAGHDNSSSIALGSTATMRDTESEFSTELEKRGVNHCQPRSSEIWCKVFTTSACIQCRLHRTIGRQKP